MELTRRDAVAALAVLGAGGAVAVGGRSVLESADGSGGSDSTDDATDSTGLPDDERVRETLVAAAEVVYPSELEGVDTFVRAFLDGRLSQGAHAEGIRETVAELDERAVAWHDGHFTDLSPTTRARLLREVGADTADEDPDGTTAERVRYYVVNELLLALYASPTGGELVGIENPQGHPGGTDTYQRGPPS